MATRPTTSTNEASYRQGNKASWFYKILAMAQFNVNSVHCEDTVLLGSDANSVRLFQAEQNLWRREKRTDDNRFFRKSNPSGRCGCEDDEHRLRRHRTKMRGRRRQSGYICECIEVIVRELSDLREFISATGSADKELMWL